MGDKGRRDIIDKKTTWINAHLSLHKEQTSSMEKPKLMKACDKAETAVGDAKAQFDEVLEKVSNTYKAMLDANKAHKLCHARKALVTIDVKRGGGNKERSEFDKAAYLHATEKATESLDEIDKRKMNTAADFEKAFDDIAPVVSSLDDALKRLPSSPRTKPFLGRK